MKKYVAGAAVAALAAGGALLAASPAYAYNGTGNAPWEPDPQSIGSVIFYNSAGQPVTSGSSLSAPFAYAAASNNSAANAGTKAQLQWAFPNHAQPTSAWFVDAPGTATAYPNASAPAPLNTTPNPVNTVGSNANITSITGTGADDPTANYNDVLQVRLITLGGAGGSTATGNYWDSDILYNTTTGAWTEVGNDSTQNITYTALSANPGSSPAGNNVALTATVTQSASGPVTAGSVQFYDGSTALGSPVATTNGVATYDTTSLPTGSHALSAVFTPTDTTNNTSSTGTATETVTGPATTTTLTVSATDPSNNQADGAPYAGVDTTLSGTVTQTVGGAAVSAGTVSLYDNGSATPLNSTPLPLNSSGQYGYDDVAGFSASPTPNHSVVAVFTPTDAATDAGSRSGAVAFTVTAKPAGACTNASSSCTDTQDIEAGVPVGTITITTPYNGTSCASGLTQGSTPDPNSLTSTPGCVNGYLNIGTLALNSSDSEFTANTTFQDIVVNDNLSGTQLWSVSALSSPLSDGGTSTGSTIAAKYVGLTGLTQNTAEEGANQFTGTVTTSAATAATPATGDTNTGLSTNPTIATATAAGQGAYAMDGTITLNAPTSTEAGLFKGTVTFTVATQ